METQTLNFLQSYKLEGSELDILHYPDPLLKKKALAYQAEEIDENLIFLAKNMLYTMYKAPGIGLAAPQVGVSKRMFVIDIDFERTEVTRADGRFDYEYSNFNPQVFINPIIENKRGSAKSEEGCLSVPGVYEEVERASEITLKYTDLLGENHEVDFDGIMSICLQHENDHLDGVVFIEKLSYLKRSLLIKKLMKEKRRGY